MRHQAMSVGSHKARLLVLRYIWGGELLNMDLRVVACQQLRVRGPAGAKARILMLQLVLYRCVIKKFRTAGIADFFGPRMRPLIFASYFVESSCNVLGDQANRTAFSVRRRLSYWCDSNSPPARQGYPELNNHAFGLSRG